MRCKNCPSSFIQLRHYFLCDRAQKMKFTQINNTIAKNYMKFRYPILEIPATALAPFHVSNRAPFVIKLAYLLILTFVSASKCNNSLKSLLV